MHGKDEDGNPVPSFDIYLAYDPKSDRVEYRLTYREFEGDSDDVIESSFRGLIPAESFVKIWRRLQAFAPEVVTRHETMKKIETAEAIKDAEAILKYANIIREAKKDE